MRSFACSTSKLSPNALVFPANALTVPKGPLMRYQSEYQFQNTHMPAAEISLISRLLEFRRQKRVGVILAEYGRYWICDDEYDPHGSKIKFTVDMIRILVHKLELEDLIERKSVGREYESRSQEQADVPESLLGRTG